MNGDRLESILNRLPDLNIVVVGDFFLDRYLVIDKSLEETSLETGFPAHQVVSGRSYPGAAGVVASNLAGLGVGSILSVGITGLDGDGFELHRRLAEMRVETRFLLKTPDRLTPTYNKLILNDGGVETEFSRLDIRTREELPADLEDKVILAFREALSEAEGAIIVDQEPHRNVGVVTDRVREEMVQIARENPNKFFLVDSRERIGDFTGIMLKPNKYEAMKALDPQFQGEPTLEEVQQAGRQLSKQARKPVFLTLGKEGVLVFNEYLEVHAPAIPDDGPIDPVGAGDSCSAAIMAALCAGAAPVEAAIMAMLVAGVTVRQIGQTGVATPSDVMALSRWQ